MNWAFLSLQLAVGTAKRIFALLLEFIVTRASLSFSDALHGLTHLHTLVVELRNEAHSSIARAATLVGARCPGRHHPSG
jgi:hypothetical protein